VAGYHTSTGAPSVDKVNVVSPTPRGPGLVKLVGPRRATVGTVSPFTNSVPTTPSAGAASASGVVIIPTAAKAIVTTPHRMTVPAERTLLVTLPPFVPTGLERLRHLVTIPYAA
jgi:hypothetical protein